MYKVKARDKLDTNTQTSLRSGMLQHIDRLFRGFLEQETESGELEPRPARCCRCLTDERSENRLDGVEDGVCQIFYRVQHLVQDALDLVDNYRREE